MCMWALIDCVAGIHLFITKASNIHEAPQSTCSFSTARLGLPLKRFVPGAKQRAPPNVCQEYKETQDCEQCMRKYDNSAICFRGFT